MNNSQLLIVSQPFSTGLLRPLKSKYLFNRLIFRSYDGSVFQKHWLVTRSNDGSALLINPSITRSYDGSVLKSRSITRSYDGSVFQSIDIPFIRRLCLSKTLISNPIKWRLCSSYKPLDNPIIRRLCLEISFDNPIIRRLCLSNHRLVTRSYDGSASHKTSR